MKVLEVEGKTPVDATKRGLAELGIRDDSSVKVEVIEEGKSGIFGFGVSRSAKVRIFYSSNTEDVGDITKECLMNILNKMNIDAEIKDLKEGEAKVYIELESKKNSGLIIGRKGKTLEALQFILNLMINHKTRSEKKIILDIEAYRAKRERAIKKMSREIAYKVNKTGKPWTLEPMNPFERRLIHLTLQNDTRVVTRSEGQGIYRKVTVLPKR